MLADAVAELRPVPDLAHQVVGPDDGLEHAADHERVVGARRRRRLGERVGHGYEEAEGGEPPGRGESHAERSTLVPAGRDEDTSTRGARGADVVMRWRP